MTQSVLSGCYEPGVFLNFLEGNEEYNREVSLSLGAYSLVKRKSEDMRKKFIGDDKSSEDSE